MMFEMVKRWTQSEHERVQERLSDYMDGRLSAGDRAKVERHMAACVRCSADLASLRQTADILRATPVRMLPRSFVLPASEGIRQRQVRRQRVTYGYLRMATAVCSVLLALVLSSDALLRAPVFAARPAFDVSRGQEPEPNLTVMQEPQVEADAVEQEDSVQYLASAPQAPVTEVAGRSDGEAIVAKAVPSPGSLSASGSPPAAHPAPQVPTPSQPSTVVEASPSAEAARSSDAPANPSAAPGNVAAVDTAATEPGLGLPPGVVASPVSAAPTGWWPLLDSWRAILPWVELSLAGAVVLLLLIMILSRQRERLLLR